MSKISSLFDEKQDKILREYFKEKAPVAVKVHLEHIGKELRKVKKEDYENSDIPLVIVLPSKVVPIGAHTKELEGLETGVSECFKKIPGMVYQNPYAIVGINLGLEHKGRPIIEARGNILKEGKRPLDMTETVNLMKFLPFTLEVGDSLCPSQFFTNTVEKSPVIHSPVIYKLENFNAQVIPTWKIHFQYPRTGVPYCSKTVFKPVVKE